MFTFAKSTTTIDDALRARLETGTSPGTDPGWLDASKRHAPQQQIPIHTVDFEASIPILVTPLGRRQQPVRYLLELLLQ